MAGEKRFRICTVAMAASACLLAGCSGINQWWHSGLKVGPDYCGAPVSVADQWADEGNQAIKSEPADDACWWAVFNDPVLDGLIQATYHENLSLQIAGWRIIEARAQRGIAAGNLFPQQQGANAGYSRNKFSDNMYPFGAFPGNREFDNWMVGFDMAWELDLWGRIRRGVEAADANLEAQAEGYDDALVMLQAEVAAAYLQMRTIEEQWRYARKNAELQRTSLGLIQKRFEQGIVGELDVRQAGAELAITESLIPRLEQAHRQVQNGLCVLVGRPPGSLQAELSEPRPIPSPPAEVAVGIPADLLRRRPDVRRAERQAAAQSARIGMAEADFYPQLAITGTISFEAEQFGDLFNWQSLGGRVGPGLRWDLLNYGRIRNRVRVEDARFRQAVLAYQNTVLVANKEAEDAIVAYLREQQRVRLLEQATREVIRALEIGLRLYEQGVVDYQRVLDSQRAAVQQQDALAQSRGQVAINLVAVYKALGGGWAMRCADGGFAPDAAVPAEILPDAPPAIPPPAEGIPAPSPAPATIPPESHGLSQ
ncbi:MAG: efflux transporter outer membrane subunit [Pirellulaceae bacterium]|nr:efflux transporter outer membrane subunit [Pirellulaceae bacterium]